MNMIDLLTKNTVRRAERCHNRHAGSAAIRERIAASDLGTNNIEVRDNLSVTQRLEIAVGLHSETSVVLAGKKTSHRTSLSSRRDNRHRVRTPVP